MTTLVALLPAAICGLIGAIVGFYYARKEHECVERKKAESDKQADEPYLPFVETHTQTQV
jgi:hypothetical protein